jgi:hypothetical protein
MKMCENNSKNDEKLTVGRNTLIDNHYLIRTALYANDGFYEVCFNNFS